MAVIGRFEVESVFSCSFSGLKRLSPLNPSEPQLPIACLAARGGEKVVTVQAVFGGVDLDDLFAVDVEHHQSDIGPHPQATAAVLQHIVDNLGVEPDMSCRIV